MTIEYNERKCEPSRCQARWLFRGLSAFLLASTVAVGAEIASDHDDAPDAGKARIEDYAPYTEEDPTKPVTPDSAYILLGAAKAALQEEANYAVEQVRVDGSPETVQACQATLERLNREAAQLRLGGILSDCTPQAR